LFVTYVGYDTLRQEIERQTNTQSKAWNITLICSDRNSDRICR
jgi:hypothetical protein